MVSSMFYTPSSETEQNDILLTWWSPACSQSPGCPPGWSWQRQGSCGSRQCGFASSWTPRQKPGWRPWRRCSLQSSPGTVSDLQRVMLDTAFETRMCWPSCDRVTGIQSSLFNFSRSCYCQKSPQYCFYHPCNSTTWKRNEVSPFTLVAWRTR